MNNWHDDYIYIELWWIIIKLQQIYQFIKGATDILLFKVGIKALSKICMAPANIYYGYLV